jgi:hypothetical protein
MMSTPEMITELRQLIRVNSCSLVVSVPFLTAVADRLERLEKLKQHFLDAESAIKYDPGCKSEPL